MARLFGSFAMVLSIYLVSNFSLRLVVIGINHGILELLRGC